MEKTKLDYYKQKLLKLKMHILNSGILSKREDLEISSDDLPDEADIAQNVIAQEVTFNIRAREITKLRQIEFALQRVEDGSYGHCEDCEEPISEKRLENQPWTECCITHAEERERFNQNYKKVG